MSAGSRLLSSTRDSSVRYVLRGPRRDEEGCYEQPIIVLQEDELLRGVEGDKEKSLHRGGCTVREFPFDPVTEGRVPSSIVSRTIRLRPSSSKPIHPGTKRCLGMTAMYSLSPSQHRMHKRGTVKHRARYMLALTLFFTITIRPLAIERQSMSEVSMKLIRIIISKRKQRIRNLRVYQLSRPKSNI